jgi:phosphate transport system permease protein
VTTGTENRASEGTRDRAPGRTVRRHRGALQILGALITAAGAILIARAAFGVTNLFIDVVIGYAVFIITVAIVEFTANPADVEIDLRERDDTRRDSSVSNVLVEPVALQVVPDIDAADDQPLRFRSFSRKDVAEVIVALVVATAFAELLRIALRMQSLVGLAVWWYIAFIAIYFLLSRDRDNAEAALDRVMTMLVWSTGILVGSLLVWIIAYVFAKGLPTLTATFFTQDMSKVGPLSPGGGAKHAIIGTIEQVGLATLVVVPVGILTAVYLHEIRGKMAAPVRFIIDAMSGLPSIVAGLFIYTAWVTRYGYSGLAGALALAVLMLPTMTRASEEILRTVPDTLREGAMALGAPQWRLVQRVVLPTALTGIVTAGLLAVARAIGETAPLLFTAFNNDSTNVNALHDPQAALPTFVWKLIFLPDQAAKDRAWAGATILIMLVFVLFVSARIVTNRGTRKLEGRR